MVLDEPKDDDERVEQDGLTFLISKDLSDRSGKVAIDFKDEGWNRGFTLSSEKPIVPDLSGDDCGGSCSC